MKHRKVNTMRFQYIKVGNHTKLKDKHAMI